MITSIPVLKYLSPFPPFKPLEPEPGKPEGYEGSDRQPPGGLEASQVEQLSPPVIVWVQPGINGPHQQNPASSRG